MKSRYSKQGGFTLVEIAIVLVIVGLLIGGVLKGQEMISAAKMKNFVQTWKAHTAAVYGFQDKYRALPGDMVDANTKIPGVTSTDKNGNGNGTVTLSDPRSCSTACEGQLFWEHLDAAGFMQTGVDSIGTGTAERTLGHSYGGRFTGVYHSTGGLRLYAHHGYNTPTGTMIMRDVALIDQNYDDGKPGSGKVVEHSYARTGSGFNPTTPGTYNNMSDGAQMDQGIANTWYSLD